MKNRFQWVTLAALVILGTPLMAEAQGAYKYEAFNYPGAAWEQVFSLNGRGDVVGNATVSPDSIPYVYNSKEQTFENVTRVPGYLYTAALGISNEGALVGSVFDGSVESGLIIGNTGGVTVFNHPDAVAFTQARGINSKGLITGFRDSPDDQMLPQNGFIYDPKKGTFIDIVPSLFTIAQGINSRGDVVGSAFFDGRFGAPDPCGSNEPLVQRGWLRAKDGTVTYFAVNDGQTSARGITSSGLVAGFVRNPGDNSARGFVVELGDSECQFFTIADGDLIHFPGSSSTVVQSINDSGDIAGTYDVDGTSFGFVGRPQ